MSKGRRRAGAEWRLRLMLIGQCCGKGIEQMQKEGGRELVEHLLDCGYTGICVLLGTLRVKEEQEGVLGHVVWMMREEENSVNEVGRSIVTLGQCCEWGTS
jgi:DNA-binding LacI/PurR family transcriptional regulator